MTCVSGPDAFTEYYKNLKVLKKEIERKLTYYALFLLTFNSSQMTKLKTHELQKH